MKDFIIYAFIIIAAISCTTEYEINTNITLPNLLDGPDAVTLIAGSSAKETFAWSGGKADDGSYVAYEIVFDKQDGDFSNPIYKQGSDGRGKSRVTITHAQLNVIARDAGVGPLGTANLKWTIKASKGGISHLVPIDKAISVTRFDGVSEIPETLFLYGSATENSGAGGFAFRKSADGVFVIYTKLSNGFISFQNSTAVDADKYYFESRTNQIKEGEGGTTVTDSDNAVRIIIDFNSNILLIDEVTGIRMIWMDSHLSVGQSETNDVTDDFSYLGNGEFVLPNRQLTVEHRHPAWPTGQTSTDDKYFMIANVGGTDYHWRRAGSNTVRPDESTSPSYFQIADNIVWGSDATQQQWWLLALSVQNKKCDVAIYTNKEGIMYHSFKVIP
jgi:hypothetical protein